MPACPTVSVAADLEKLGGTATWAQLRTVVNKRALLTAVRDGSIVKVLRGLYSLPASVDRSTARRLHGAIRTGLVTARELRRAVAPLRGAGVVKARRVAGWVDARAASPLESALRGLLLDNGFTQFEPQLAVVHEGRRVATVDLGDPATGLLLEADSFLWHGQRAALERDARRYNELVSRGFLVLRFTWEQIMSDPAWVLAMVRRALNRPDRQDGSRQVTG